MSDFQLGGTVINAGLLGSTVSAFFPVNHPFLPTGVLGWRSHTYLTSSLYFSLLSSKVLVLGVKRTIFSFPPV